MNRLTAGIQLFLKFQLVMHRQISAESNLGSVGLVGTVTRYLVSKLSEQLFQ